MQNTFYVLNLIASIANIVIFFIEIIMLTMTDFLNSHGNSKGTALFYLILSITWRIFPGVLSLIFHELTKQIKILAIILLILNIYVLVINMPMLMAFFKH